jgi:Putative peptidoglycan binding domain
MIGIARVLMAIIAFVAADVRSADAGIICQETVFNPNLVRAVQHKLREAKARTTGANGRWDNRMPADLRRFQQRRQLPPTGELDEPTFRTMFGAEQPYEPVSRIVKNPQGHSLEMYSRFCP